MSSVLKTWYDRRSRRYQLAVWAALARRAERGQPWAHVYDLWREVGGSSGALYVALARLEHQTGEVISKWDEGSYPRRRLYAVRDCLLRAGLQGVDPVAGVDA